MRSTVTHKDKPYLKHVYSMLSKLESDSAPPLAFSRERVLKEQIKKGALNLSRLNYLVRDPISFVGFPWRTTAALVRGRVFSMLYRSPPEGDLYLAGSLTKNPEEEDFPRRIYTMCFEGGPLPTGSWLGHLPRRKHPRGVIL